MSAPVEDSDHNIVVLVGDVGVCEECDPQPVDRVSLVSLSPFGEERWSVEISVTSAPRGLIDPAPVISPDDETTVCVDGDVVRVSSSGTIRWRADDGCIARAEDTSDDDCWEPGHAVAEDGAYAVLRRVVETGWARATEVLVFSRDGQLRWSKTIGVASTCSRGFDTILHGSFIDGLAFDVAGNLVVGCDTCGAHPAVVRLDAKNGDLVDATAIPEQGRLRNEYDLAYARYTSPTLANGNPWVFTHAFDTLLWRIEGGVATAAPGLSLPLDAGGRVQRDFASADLEVLWGDETVVLDPADAEAFPEFEQAYPLAVTADDRVLMGYGDTTGVEPGQYNLGIYLLDRDGQVVWRSPDVFGRVPLVSHGAIAYVGEHGLVVREAPVSGLANGSWPSLNGDARGSFREGR